MTNRYDRILNQEYPVLLRSGFNPIINLVRLIQPHRTTVIDVQLVRVPSPDIYRIVRA